MKDLFTEIDDKGGYHVDKFINKILVLNLAFNLMDLMLFEEPTIRLSIDSVNLDLLRISVKPTTPDFNHGDFTDAVTSLSEGLAVNFFSLSLNTLDKVFSKMIQTTNFDAFQIKESITTKHKRTFYRRRTTINR